ncbi:class I SAM-dependent methyltransferase [Motilibacter aurantiacus]|uniref:class I SAM-dependent methyltransferase n=1 Tax=Motilibacter aurantiacus TaxID=2714955 RepID=UPI002F2B52A3
MSTVPAQTRAEGPAAAMLRRWDDQQAAYISRREERFAIMLDVVEATVPADGLVLDLACGPGSISARVARRFPRMRCLGVDYDPALLTLARAWAGEEGHDDRVRFADADLVDPSWLSVLQGEAPHAVLSSTALHWLPGAVLARLYSDLGGILEQESVFLNADHLRAPTGRELFTALAAADDERTQATAHARGVDTWDDWFRGLADDPEYATALAERESRFADRPRNPDLSLGFHVEALRVAGFREAGPVWQHFDDYVVLARR